MAPASETLHVPFPVRTSQNLNLDVGALTWNLFVTTFCVLTLSGKQAHSCHQFSKGFMNQNKFKGTLHFLKGIKE